MLERGKMDRNKIEFVDTEGLVPADHLLRKIDAAVDFSKIYKMVEEYSSRWEDKLADLIEIFGCEF